MCVGRRMGLGSIFKNLFIKKEKEKTCRHLGRDDGFLIKKKKYIYVKKIIWQAIHRNENGGCLWVWIMSGFYLSVFLSCLHFTK